MIVSFVECSKTLVDCYQDFGQFYENPTTAKNIDRPFSPYARYLDTCKMSTTQTFTIDESELFSGTNYGRNYFRLIGYGDFGQYCWPGQLDYLFYNLENWMRTNNYITAGNPFFHTSMEDPVPPEVL